MFWLNSLDLRGCVSKVSSVLLRCISRYFTPCKPTESVNGIWPYETSPVSLSGMPCRVRTIMLSPVCASIRSVSPGS